MRERAVIQGVFDLAGTVPRLAAILGAYGVEPEPRLIVSREVLAGGGSTARLNGRIVPVKALAEVAQVLVDIHGQSENASLKRAAEHVELLDRYAVLGDARQSLSEQVAALRGVESELVGLQQDELALARQAELLAFQIDEIRQARLSEAEERGLLAERTRLANAERLALLADRAYGALRDEEGERDAALDFVAATAEAVAALAEIDPELSGIETSLVGAAEALAEQADALRDYRDRIEFDPARLEVVEERLAALADLKRKYGGDIGAVLDCADRAEAELAGITGAEARIAELGTAREDLHAAIGRLAGDLSSRRRSAGEAGAGRRARARGVGDARQPVRCLAPAARGCARRARRRRALRLRSYRHR